MGFICDKLPSTQILLKALKGEMMKGFTILVSAIVGMVIGALLALFVIKLRTKKSPLNVESSMSYEEMQKTLYRSRGNITVIDTVVGMIQGTIPYPTWENLMKLYDKSNHNYVFPVEELVIWEVAKKHKKEKEALELYPNCETYAKTIFSGKPTQDI
jgi:hypothetical protein